MHDEGRSAPFPQVARMVYCVRACLASGSKHLQICANDGLEYLRCGAQAPGGEKMRAIHGRREWGAERRSAITTP